MNAGIMTALIFIKIFWQKRGPRQKTISYRDGELYPYIKVEKLGLIPHHYDLFRSLNQGNKQSSNASEDIQWELVYLDTKPL